MTKEVSATLYGKDVSAEVDTSAIFPGDVQFLSAVKISLHEVVVGGRILLQHLVNVKQLLLTPNLFLSEVGGWDFVETLRCKKLAPHSLTDLLPAFDNAAAHEPKPPGLQKLRFLESAGARFH